MARKHEAPLRCQERWQLQLVFLALRLNGRQESARRAVKNDVQAWKTNLVQKLQQAHQAHDSREAWSISRQLAGRLYKRPRQPPKAQPITKQDWLQHFQAVQRASECSSSAAQPACLDNSCLPGSFPSLFQGEFGQQALATAAGRLQKARATPRGALPVEVWCLLLQGREHLQPGKQLMPLFELLQSMGVNFSEWCVGHGCPIPKPGGDAGPNGHRVINLLDPLGKVFYKAALDLHPDPPKAHQYGYSAKRSRRDAILQISALLDRLQQAHLCTATILYDLTKAFDMISAHSVVCNIQEDPSLHCDVQSSTC